MGLGLGGHERVLPTSPRASFILGSSQAGNGVKIDTGLGEVCASMMTSLGFRPPLCPGKGSLAASWATVSSMARKQAATQRRVKCSLSGSRARR